MNNRIARWTAALLAGMCIAAASHGAAMVQNNTVDLTVEPSGVESAPQSSAPLSEGELDQLTAPIALYSDPLLGMILSAATYPLEIVEAARWLDVDDHAALQGDDLNTQLAAQSWDRSVKGLVAVPEVLRMMNENIEWTERLGNAFLTQQAGVMDSIQFLRRRAADSGALHSSPEETVSTSDDEIVIEPVSVDVLYVPCYTPVIYGAWPWPAYPPFYFPPSTGFCPPGPLLTFGIGFGIVGPYWGWGRWNWRRHQFYVVPWSGGHPVRPWRHNPAHRHGVPYRDAATTHRYPGPDARSWRAHPGFPTRPARPPRPRSPAPGKPDRGAWQGAPGPLRHAPRHTSPPSGTLRRGSPTFQSFRSSPRVREETSRGTGSGAAPSHSGSARPARGRSTRPPRQ